MILDRAMRTQEWHWDLVESALTEVCSPWPAPPGKRIERGLLDRDGSPLGIPEVIDTLKSAMSMMTALRAEAISESALETARRHYQLHRAKDDLFDLIMRGGCVGSCLAEGAVNMAVVNLHFELRAVYASS